MYNYNISQCCFRNPLPFLHDDITEQMDVRHHVLLNLLLDDAPQVLQHDNCLAEEAVGKK